jgi:hypothetical protein
MLMSPHITTFLELELIWLKTNSKEFRKYEKFPVGGPIDTYNIKYSRRNMELHSTNFSHGHYRIYPNQWLRNLMCLGQKYLHLHLYGSSYNNLPQVYNMQSKNNLFPGYVGGVR